MDIMGLWKKLSGPSKEEEDHVIGYFALASDISYEEAEKLIRKTALVYGKDYKF